MEKTVVREAKYFTKVTQLVSSSDEINSRGKSVYFLHSFTPYVSDIMPSLEDKVLMKTCPLWKLYSSEQYDLQSQNHLTACRNDTQKHKRENE